MKIGSFKVKRNYQISQMVLDVVGAVIFAVIVRCVISFGAFIDEQNRIIQNSNSEIKGLVVWQWNIVWIVIAALVIVISLLMIYLPRKMPRKYVVTKETVQKYSDIVITAVTCVRIPVLLAVFEGMCIHQSVMVGNIEGVFTLQIPLDILLSIIIIRFSIHRVRILPKPQEKEITIKES
ncbi:MAG: hypothetical protein NC203_01015 [Firmicutes bacterium]|nr:hypothetical protein [Bacillota bacterium]